MHDIHRWFALIELQHSNLRTAIFLWTSFMAGSNFSHLEEVVVVVVLGGGVDNAVGAVQPLHVTQSPLPTPVAQRLLTEDLK